MSKFLNVKVSYADVPVVDPGPDSRMSLDPDPEGKNDPQKIENKVNKFHFEVNKFHFEVLDVLF